MNINYFICIPVVLLMFNTSAYAIDYTPVELVETKKGSKCGKPTSEEVVYRNVSSQTLQLRLCVNKRKNNKWSCVKDSVLKPGEELGHYACDGINEHKYWWGISGDSYITPPTTSPSGRFPNAKVSCGSKKVLFWLEEKYEGLSKFHLTNGGVLQYKKHKVKIKDGEFKFVYDLHELNQLLCGSDFEKKSTALGTLRSFFRKRYLKQCQSEGKSRKECTKYSKNDLWIGVRG